MRIIAIAHDTGGAQLVASLIQAEAERLHWLPGAFRASPADGLFRHLPDTVAPTIYLDGADAALILRTFRPDLLVTATSSAMVELPFIRAARALRIPSVSLPDHWINYRERFGYPAADWMENVPDVVAVGDSVALALAREAGFPHVLPLKNYYMADMLRRYQALPAAPDDNPGLLVLSQVIPFDPQRTTGVHQAVVAPYERQIVHDILADFDNLARFLDVETLVVRTHPAMRGALYNDLAEQFPGVPFSIERPADRDLVASLRPARLVLGHSSMALFTATALGLDTYSFMTDDMEKLPPVGRRIIRSVKDIPAGTATASPFRHDGVFTGEDNNFTSFLGQIL